MKTLPIPSKLLKTLVLAALLAPFACSAADEAEKAPERDTVHSNPYGAANEWVDNRELDIELTLIVDREGCLAGAAIYGSEAGTWIDFLTLIINKKITGAELDSMIFAFPTQTFMLASTLTPLLKKAE